MIKRILYRFLRQVRVVGLTADRRTKEQRLQDQHRAILRSDARVEIEFRELVRANQMRRIEAKYRRNSILTKQAG